MCTFRSGVRPELRLRAWNRVLMAGYSGSSRAIDALRSRQVRFAMFEQPLEEISDPRDRRSDPEHLSIEQAQAHIISNLLAELPVDRQQAIKLAYFLGLSHSEIAARSGLPLGAVKTRIRLGMLRLRELLAPYAEGL